MQQTVVLPVAYFAPVSYYGLLHFYQNHYIEKHEHFIKQTIRSRCYILGANGSLTLSIPVERPSGMKIKIDELKINKSEQWQRIHWQSILSAYNSSPFFEYYEDYFKKLYEKQFDFLFDFNIEIHETILKLLKMPKEILFTNTYKKEYPVDYRNEQKIFSDFLPKEYYQVFSYKTEFVPNLSIIDLLCNEGPRAKEFL